MTQIRGLRQTYQLRHTHNGLWPGHKAWLCFNFKISIPWAPLRQTITSFDSWPPQGHFRSQVYSHSVATWRISFGRHIRLEFRHCAHLPDRLRRFPTINDKYDISRSNLTLTLWSWPELKFWPWCFYVNMYVFRCVSVRGIRWCQNYFDCIVRKLWRRKAVFIMAISTFSDLQSLTGCR